MPARYVLSASERPRLQPEVERALGLSVIDGLLHAFMLGTTESYLGTFAVELGYGNAEIASLITVPLLFGAVSQLFAGPVAAWCGGRKRLVVAGALLQSLTLLGFAVIAHLGSAALFPFLLCKVVFSISGSILAPGWGSWMAALTEDANRERYFARRSGLIQVSLLSSFALSGLVLNDTELPVLKLERYMGLFVLAFVARAASVIVLMRQYDPETHAAPSAQAFRRLAQAVRESQLRVPVYSMLLQFGGYVAAPFFTPYMLRVLGVSYASFVWFIASATVVKALVFPACHGLALRFGLKPLLLVGGATVSVLPSMWVWWPTFGGILSAHVLGAVGWAFVEFATFQLLLKGSSSDCRVEYLSFAAATSGVGQLLGSMLGIGLLTLFDSNYPEVFSVSSWLRALPLLVLLTLPKADSALWGRRIYTRIMGTRPGEGTVNRPIVSDAELTDEEPKQ